MDARNRGRQLFLALLVLAVLPAGPAVAAHESGDDEVVDKLLQEKCSLCHSGHRINHMDPDKVKDVVERMQRMNPSWITEIDRDHIIEVLSRLLNDSTIIAERKAWEEAVARGKVLFGNSKLGTTGKSCADCHTEKDLRKAADEFPRFDPDKMRLISFSEKINMMIAEKMKGNPIDPLSQERIDLEAYLKSLR